MSNKKTKDDSNGLERFYHEFFDRFTNPFVVSAILAIVASYPGQFYKIWTNDKEWSTALDEITFFSLRFLFHLLGILLFYFVAPALGKSIQFGKEHIVKFMDEKFFGITYFSKSESQELRNEIAAMQNVVFANKNEMLEVNGTLNSLKGTFIDFFNGSKDSKCFLSIEEDSSEIRTPFLYNKYLEKKEEGHWFDADFKNRFVRFDTKCFSGKHKLFVNIHHNKIPEDLPLGNYILFQNLRTYNNTKWDQVLVSSKSNSEWAVQHPVDSYIRLYRKQNDPIVYINVNISVPK